MDGEQRLMREMELGIDELTLDPAIQPRQYMCQEVIADYAEQMANGQEFPPVRAFFDGQRYWLSRGFHRTHAAARNGRLRIRAEVFDGDRADAVRDAAGSNVDHGLRRT